MGVHLIKEIENLKMNVLALSAIVEESVYRAAKSVESGDVEAARALIDADIEIDKREVEIEEDCLKILALHQPVALDLRVIVAFLKINNDLERIGDLAVNIAERTLNLSNCEKPKSVFDFSDMAKKATLMLKRALDSLINKNAETATQVGAMDDEVDAMYRQTVVYVKEAIAKYPEQTETYLQYLSIARHLERIADHAANIAEDVLYMIEGEIVRHKFGDKKKSDPQKCN